MKGEPTSAAFAFQVAMVDRLAADPLLGAMLGGTGDDAKIYAQRAPDDVTLPYLVIAQTTEASAGLSFDKWSNRGSVTIDIWTDLLAHGNSQGLAIYGHVKRLLQGARFGLEGHDVITCTVSLVVDLVDQDGKTHHTQALVEPVSQQHRA